jgi:maleate isomerase
MTEEVRLGVILPSVNTVVENWYPKIVPDGVSVHFARMLIADGSSPEEIIAMDREDGVRAIHQIAGCRAHAIALRLHSIEHYPRPRVRRTPAYRDPAYR